jgi:hypothetical protein
MQRRAIFAKLSQALLGIDTMYHAIHAFGLAELLKSGNIANVDDEHFYNLIDNTYIDDVGQLSDL